MSRKACQNSHERKDAFFCVTLLLFLSNAVFSQEDMSRKRNALYAELTSSDPVYSVNYERIFSSREKVSYSYRAGFSISNHRVYLPLGVSLLTGTRASHAEFSLVLAPYIKQYAKRGHEKGDAYLYIIPGVGYRYQHRKAGPFLKLVASPAVLVDAPKDLAKMQSSVHAALYFSAGYSF